VDEFMDTMGFFAASLSWNCTDCHGENAVDNWANFADETPRKISRRCERLNWNVFPSRLTRACCWIVAWLTAQNCG